MDVYLNEVTCELSEVEIDNIALGAQFGFPDTFIESKLGFLTRRELSGDRNIIDLFSSAAMHLDIDDSVLAIIWVSQTSPFKGIPHLSAAAQKILGLAPSVLSFDMGLGCSGYPAALHVAKSIVQSSGRDDAEVLIVTGDAYSKIVDPTDKDTALIFGDGLSISRVSVVAKGLAMKIGSFATHTTFSKALCSESGGLEMNGREVYNYVLSTVRPLVDSCMGESGFSLDEVSRVYAHQGSKHIVRQVGRALELDDVSCPFYSQHVGNMVSTSIPFGLSTISPEPGVHVLLGFGVGLQATAIQLEKSV